MKTLLLSLSVVLLIGCASTATTKAPSNALAAAPVSMIHFDANNQPMVGFANASYFNWIPPNGTLPSEQTCAEEIAYTPEGIPNNVAMNGIAPTAAQLAPFYANPNGNAGQVLPPADFQNVTGDYPSMLATVPSTDMIIRWAACKWGVDEDSLRAQAWEESNWREDATGDYSTGVSGCTQPGFTSLYQSRVSFPSGNRIEAMPKACWTSWSLFQHKLWYFDTAYPLAINSTAFAADFMGALIRGCLNGDQAGYYNSGGSGGPNNGYNSYATDTSNPADLTELEQGCMATHFSGGWWTNGAPAYWNAIAGYIQSKPWPGGL